MFLKLIRQFNILRLTPKWIRKVGSKLISWSERKLTTIIKFKMLFSNRFSSYDIYFYLAFIFISCSLVKIKIQLQGWIKVTSYIRKIASTNKFSGETAFSLFFYFYIQPTLFIATIVTINGILIFVCLFLLMIAHIGYVKICLDESEKFNMHL